MVQATDIREHMEVLGSDGAHVGTVDHVDGDCIKLARGDSADGVHHYIPLSSVDHVDAHVHLNTTAAAALASGAGAATATAAAAPYGDRAADPADRRRPSILPWILGIIGLALLFLLLRSCMDRDAPVSADPAVTGTTPATAPLAVESVALPDGTRIDLESGTLNYALQRYLASSDPAPRTFTFDTLNFDSGKADIRAADRPSIDALARILAAYPAARARIVGYTDARGPASGNAALGEQRAAAVIAALVAKGVDGARLTAVSGGESNPADTNATPEGQFENRRSELIVTAK